MLRRLHKEQPATFAFTPANQQWAAGQISKYPEGRQASAIIPLLWRAQEQDGWLTRPAIEHIADMLGMAYIRALEVATFYFMFQLQPVGKIANIQICGTTSCMICGAEDLIAVCKELIAPKAHTLSADGNFSWEEVECLGACTNAPMAQIGKDYYEDLTPDTLRDLIARFAKGEVPVPGPQNGRYASEPLIGLTSLQDHAAGRKPYNASAQAAVDLGDTVKRIDGTEVPILTPWLGKSGSKPAKAPNPTQGAPKMQSAMSAPQMIASEKAASTTAVDKGRPATATADVGSKPAALASARDGKADDLKQIKGIGPKLEELCNTLGFYHFDQIANWSDAEIAWMDENLEGFKGRVTRDTWVAQAKPLAAGGETDFSARVEKAVSIDL
ncbi:NADH dehydrogenase subunit E [Pseudorhodobacter antarcticus]|jgi:NADH-quinone oxidoreductase subunit E|uniref:NADH dehydrogenase subunit E n=1 Tax=Pseudorhodobacter antarcticus TaxID=1077947 RepID=A0A1H8G8T3_9RHOB|nr:NADH-quinone oxidoreductase subunit E [Pseudorhodobacter antarcticus]SEN39698.1 NADH dehydrogenase subunit E [Pseudorhodobacter antarcticus]